MEKKRIRVVHIIGSLKRGGRERQLCTLVANSDKSSIKHSIVCLNHELVNYEDEYGLTDFICHLRSRYKLGRLSELIQIVKRIQPDILYAWGSNEYIYARFCGLILKHVILVNGCIRHGIRSKTITHFVRMLILHFSPIIVANSAAGLMANRLGPKKYRYILYNGIDTKFAWKDKIEVNSIGQQLGIPSGCFVFMSVANFVPYKDYPTILKALRLIAERRPAIKFMFIAIGTGPLQATVENLALDLGIQDQVRLIGPVNNVEGFLQLADLFIHSSKGEGCSNAILEAMYAGLPVVACDTGGTSEILEPSYSELFHYKDFHGLCDKLEKVLIDRDMKEMGLMAKSTVEKNYSVVTMVENFNSIMKDILKQTE